MKVWTKYTAAECPLKENCTKPAWDRAKCFSWDSAEDCRSRIVDHIMKSSLHYDFASAAGVESAREMAALVEIYEEPFEMAEDWEKEEQPPSKRARSSQPAPRPIGAPAKHGGGSSSSAGGDWSVVQSPPHLAKPDDDLVTVRRSLLRRLLDSVERSATAAGHAVKISTSARDA